MIYRLHIYIYRLCIIRIAQTRFSRVFFHVFLKVDLVDLAPVVPSWKKKPGAPLKQGGGMKPLSVELLPHPGTT